MIDEGRRGSGPTYFVTVALWYNISHMFSQSPNPTSGQRQRQSQRHRQRHRQRQSQRKRQMIDVRRRGPAHHLSPCCIIFTMFFSPASRPNICQKKKKTPVSCHKKWKTILCNVSNFNRSVEFIFIEDKINLILRCSIV